MVTLTTGEFDVLKALVLLPREPLRREKLMNLARGREWGAMERSIDVQVSHRFRRRRRFPAMELQLPQLSGSARWHHS
ncbi:winged helix-turn-helix domain-containing protein [Klebsiella pneumoniae]